MKLQDSEAFERAFTQLRPLYDDASLSVSPKRNLCLGLNLMRLLADNQLWQFHSQVRGMGDEQTVVCVCVCVSPPYPRAANSIVTLITWLKLS